MNSVAEASFSVLDAPRTRSRVLRVDLSAEQKEFWSRRLQLAAQSPAGTRITLVVPSGGLVPLALDDLRAARGLCVSIVSDDWATADRWQAALDEGVGAWLGLM
ncbi:MAG: hypothetical protein ACRDAX_06010 [Propionibacteriaceae bacterium]